MKDNIPNEVIEFQPSALEIKNERLPLWVRLCVWLPFVAISATILWACLAEVDVIVQGRGKIVTDRPTVVLKPLERSVIKDINVRIGDIVKENQVLITFDPTINNAELERLAKEVATLGAQFARLQSEFLSKPFKINDANIEEQWQLAIYTQRQEYFKEKMNYYDSTLRQIDAARKSRLDSIKKQTERLNAVLTLEEMFKKLHEKQATSLKELLEISITRMEMEANVDQLENGLLELEQQYSSTEATKQSFVQEWLNGISQEMVTTERNLSSTRKEHEKIQQLCEYIYLRTPCDAMVHEIADFSPGSAVREAEAIITLIPLTGVPEMEVEIRPQDIGKISVGSEVRLKLNAYPFQRHGTLDGVVRIISENTLAKERSQMTADDTSSSYYRARVMVFGQLERVKSDFRLIPGMEGQAEIKTGRRKVIEYLVYPLIKAFDETAREP